MNGLKDIRDDIQNIAEAMLSVLNIDVTIVDEHLERIAGTGTYLEKIGDKVEGYSAFKKCLEEQVIIYIDDSQKNDICKVCSNNGNCKEHAELCCPITLDGYSYGVVGLIAFNKEQSDIIKDNAKDLTNFLGKMADLISNKLKAQIKTEELELEKKKLEILLNSMNKAVVSIDKEGNIDKYNVKFKEIFNMRDDNIDGENIFQLLDFIKKPSTNDLKKHKTGVFYYKENSRNLKGIYNVSEIAVKNKLKGYVIDFIENKDAIKNYNKINKDYKITLDNIISESEIMEHTKQKALIASKSNSTVLITGESGTGKELFARAIHNHSDRVDNTFVTVNCAAIPDNLLESELFGYEEGAFTGAKKGGKLGKFEIAHKGTIFLDEIGDAPYHFQARLLRVIQEREITPVGATEITPIDVRIIAATNKNLFEEVEKNNFREDLFYRLNVMPISTLPLRDRKEDIEQLIRYYLMKNKVFISLDDFLEEETLKFFYEYNWPGNIRELINIVEYLINIREDEKIKIEDLPLYMQRNTISNKDLSKQTKILDKDTIWVLDKIYKYNRIGRRSLALIAEKENKDLGEGKIRTLLSNLQKESFIKINKGKKGTEILEKGIEMLKSQN